MVKFKYTFVHKNGKYSHWIMNKKEKRKLFKLIKKLNIMSCNIKPKKGCENWYDISLSGYTKGRKR